MNEEVRLRKMKFEFALEIIVDLNRAIIADYFGFACVFLLSSQRAHKAFKECPFLNHIDSHEVNKLNNGKKSKEVIVREVSGVLASGAVGRS